MTLSELFSETEWNQTELARELGVTQSWVHKLSHDKARCSVGLAARIEVASGGLVGIQELPLEDGAARELAALSRVLGGFLGSLFEGKARWTQIN